MGTPRNFADSAECNRHAFAGGSTCSATGNDSHVFHTRKRDEPPNVDALFSYTGFWRRNFAMYGKALTMRVFDAQTGSRITDAG